MLNLKERNQEEKDIPNSCKSVFTAYVKCKSIRRWNPFLEDKHCETIRNDLDECIKAFSPYPIFVFDKITNEE